MKLRGILVIVLTLAAIAIAAILLRESSLPRLPVENGASIPIEPMDPAWAAERTPKPTRYLVDPGTSAPDQTCEVSVRSTSGVIENASVEGVCGPRTVRAATDHLGIARLSFSVSTPEAEDLLLQVSAQGFATSISRHHAPWNRRIEVELTAAGAAVEGIVRLRNGLAPPSTLQVVAWPADATDTGALVAHGGGIRTDVGDGGAFRIDGLVDGLSYVMAVAGPGWTAWNHAKVVPSRVQPVTGVVITACRLYGTIVRAFDSAGRRPGHSDFAVVVCGVPSMSRSLSSMAYAENVDWALAGLWTQAQLYDPREQWWEWLMAYKGDTEGAVPWANVRYRIPGYLAAAADVPLSPLSTTMPVHIVTLQRNHVPLVDVAVRFQPQLGRASTRLRGRPAFELLFSEPEDAGERKWRKYFDALRDCSLQGVPAGRYEVELVRGGMTHRWHPVEGRRLTFEPGAANRITFDLSNLTALHVVGPDKSWEDAPRRIRLRRKVYDFKGGPYVLWGVPPGEAVLEVEGTAPMTVELSGGRTMVVRLESAK